MAVDTWTISDLLRIATQADEDPDWIASIRTLGVRAHERGDGLAIYINEDFGSAEMGSWKVVSYGSPVSQIETATPPTTLPDMGGAINWRYVLRAVCPSYDQKAGA